jgi:hypothetical protein
MWVFGDSSVSPASIIGRARIGSDRNRDDEAGLSRTLRPYISKMLVYRHYRRKRPAKAAQPEIQGSRIVKHTPYRKLRQQTAPHAGAQTPPEWV